MTTDQRQKILSVGLDATGVKQGMEEIKAVSNETAQVVKQSGETASKGLDSIGTGADNAAKGLDKGTRSIISSIQRTTAMMDAGEKGSVKYFESIANMRGANMDALRPYLDQLEQVIAKQHQAATGATGISAAQQAAAMRNVPAQFTDIVTSLAGGQSPLTVMLQQGGQLKDMFGGIGNAAQALGGYVSGLISPMTVVAGVAAAVAAAFYEGSKEADAFSKALIMTGNSAGTSVNQLRNISEAIASTTGNTTGAAADALQQIVSTGNVASQNLQMVATAALSMKSATGQAIEDTVKQFAELGKEPVKASLKLNEQYGYLTAEVYKQIKALEDQGRATEAATVAQNALGQAMEDRARGISGQLGTLELAWKGVLGAAKSAWDAMLGIGRDKSLEQQIAIAKKNLETGNFGFGGETEERAKLASLEAQRDSLAKQTEQKSKQTDQDKAQIAWMREGEKYLSKQQQMEIEISKARVQGLAAGMSELEIQKRIADIKEKMSDKSQAKDPTRSRDHNDYLAQLRKDADTELDAIRAKNQQIKAAAEAEQYLQDIRNKFTRSNSAKADAIEVLPEAVARLRSELRVVDQTAEDAKNRLAHMFGDGKLSAEDYASKLAELNTITDDQRKAVIALNDRQNELNGTWQYGAEKAMQKFSDSAKNVASTTEGVFTDAFNSMADAMAQFAQTGKFNFTSLANSIIADIARAQAKMAMSGLADYFKGMFSGSSSSYTSGGVSGGNAGGAGSILASATGNVFSGAPDLHQYVNTVQTSPKFFGFDTVHKFASGGVFAEAGPEAVMPLSRDSTGRLGVIANGTNEPKVFVNVTNNSGAEAKTSQRKDAQGNSIIDIIIDQVKGSIASDISTGNGVVPAAMQGSYGLNRTAGAY